MMGRIELITPTQRDLLHHMAVLPLPDTRALKAVTTAMSKLQADPARATAYHALAGGHGQLTDLGVPVPPAYADYLALGRFRTAILLEDASKSPALAKLTSQLAP